MAAPSNHYKLGLFVVLGFVAAVVAATLLGTASLREETVKYHSFFNESVQGLDLGSPVKFRGVTIGHVASIEIAPDHRHVDVVSELSTKDIKRMGLAATEPSTLGRTKILIPPDLRAQLGTQGITGVKFIAIDFVDVKANPPPELPFPVPVDHYIPAASSVLKNLEDTLTKASDRLPEVIDGIAVVLGRVDRLLATLEKQDVAASVATTLSTIQRMFARLEEENIGERAGTTIDELHFTVAKLNAVLDRIDGDKGLVASVKSATDAFGEMGRNGRGTQRDLDATLRNVSEAAEAVRTLAEALERDPDMLLKGKAKGKGYK